MSTTLKVREFRIEEWPLYRELRFSSLKESPDAFGRTLQEEQARPTEFWKDRMSEGVQSEGSLPLIAELDSTPCGLVWARLKSTDPQEVNVYQMWVHPDYRGKGIAQAFMKHIIEWARRIGATQIVLGATCGDTPANRLYKGLGFKSYRAPEKIRPDSSLMGQAMRLQL